MRRASGLVATAPLFLCCLPCRVTGIADGLLFSLQQRVSFCLFGRFARCLIGGRPRGVGCCLRSNLGLLGKFALLALARFFTLHRAIGSSGGDGLALLSFLPQASPGGQQDDHSIAEGMPGATSKGKEVVDVAKREYFCLFASHNKS
jgi:hypothetical protein